MQDNLEWIKDFFDKAFFHVINIFIQFTFNQEFVYFD
jgi:hypothetical protein